MSYSVGKYTNACFQVAKWMKLFNVFPKETICLFLQFTSVFINIIPDAQVLYLPYTSFYSDQIPKVATFGGYSCDICVSIPWCPSFGWRNGRDGYCLGNVRLSGWSFVAEKHRASSVGQPDRPLMTPHVSPVDFPLASVVFVVCLFVFAKVWHQKATSEVFLPCRSALSLYFVVGSVVFIVWKTLVSKLSHDIQQCVAYSFPSGQCSPSSS